MHMLYAINMSVIHNSDAWREQTMNTDGTLCIGLKCKTFSQTNTLSDNVLEIK